MKSIMRVALMPLVAVLALWIGPPANAQEFPDKDITFIVPVPPGGGVDFLTRTISDRLTEKLGVPILVENRPGASAVVGTQILAQSPPDGHTIMMGYSAHVTNPLFNENVPYDPIEDFEAVILVGYIPLVLVVHPEVPAQSVEELIELARSEGGDMSYASGGAGAGAHLSGELFQYLSGVELIHVAYPGNAPALTAVLGGHVPMMFEIVTTAAPHVEEGALRALAVSSPSRSAMFPDTPTIVESGLPDFEVSAWYVVLAPAGTPADALEKLNSAINEVLAEPDVAALLAERGVEVVGGSPQEAADFLMSETERWQKVVAETGISAE